MTQKQSKKVVWHTSEVLIKHLLTLSEFVSTVRKIIDNCKSPDGKIAVELLDFSTRVGIITSYASVHVPEDINELYYIAYASGLYELICKNANESQICSVINTVHIMANGG